LAYEGPAQFYVLRVMPKLTKRFVEAAQTYARFRRNSRTRELLRGEC
jgi:hypothetical protein